MKKLVLLVILAVFSISAQAQVKKQDVISDKEKIKTAKEELRKEKKKRKNFIVPL